MYPIFFFYIDTATSELYTLSLHDALPIWNRGHRDRVRAVRQPRQLALGQRQARQVRAGQLTLRKARSEEHTSELQSHSDLVCRLLLEKKKKQKNQNEHTTLTPNRR